MRPIDADAFEEDCRKRYCTGCENYNGIKCKSCWVDDMLGEVEEAPTISPDEVRGVGKWIAHGDCGVTECSVCGWFVEEYVEYNYCPSCGARMSRAEAEKAMEVRG